MKGGRKRDLAIAMENTDNASQQLPFTTTLV
jgi:hypothetical protein